MTAMIENTEVIFERQFNGYDKSQVDRYIDSLAKAYQKVYDEHNAICGKYDSLLEEFNALRIKDEERPAADIIAKALVESEAIANKIILEASMEAEMIIETAKCDAKKIAEDAYTEKAAIKIETQKALDEAAKKTESANKTAQIIVEQANIEATKAHENARKVVDYANIEASQITTQANKERKAAREILKSAIDHMQSILEHDCIAGVGKGERNATVTDARFAYQTNTSGIAG